MTSFVVEIFFCISKQSSCHCLYFSAFFVFSDEIAFSSSLRILSGRHFFPPRRKISAWSDAYTYHMWRACFAHMLWWLSQSNSRTALSVACVAWRFCRAGRTSGEAAKFAPEVHENEQQSRKKNKTPPRGFSAFARLCHLARPTKTVMIPEIKTRFYTLPYLHDTRAANDRSSFCKITFRKIDKEQILPLKLKKGYNFLDNTRSVRLRYSEFFYNSLRPTINFRRLCLSHLLPR